MKKRLVKVVVNGGEIRPLSTECRKECRKCNSCDYSGGIARDGKLAWCFDIPDAPRPSIKI